MPEVEDRCDYQLTMITDQVNETNPLYQWEQNEALRAATGPDGLVTHGRMWGQCKLPLRHDGEHKAEWEE